MSATFNSHNCNGEALGGLPIVVSQWPRNSRDTIRVKLDTYQGRNTIDVRSWYPDAEGKLKPGKGFTVSVAHLPALAKGFAEALRLANTLGLLEGGGE